jgi:hypothetical protein
MEIPLWQALLIALAAILVGIASNAAAYRLGVNDGYMFSKDPTCPGYFKARRILEGYGKIPRSVDPGNGAEVHAKDSKHVQEP